MCFFDYILVLYFRYYCVLFLKLHPICSSYTPSQLLFHGDFSFLFYNDGEVITSPEFIFFAPFEFQGYHYAGNCYVYCRFASVKCSEVAFFFFVNAQEVVSVEYFFNILSLVLIFSLPHSGLCVLKFPSIIGAGSYSRSSLISSSVTWSVWG